MKYYYLDEDEEVSEPTDLAKLEELHLQGAILATTKVCKEGGTEWIPLYQALKGMASGAGSDSRRSAIDIPKAVQILAEKNEPKKPSTATRPRAEPESGKELSGITRAQGTLIIVFLGALICIQFFSAIRPTPKWEYRIETPSDYSFSNSMNRYGKDGWELVSARRATDALNVAGYECIFRRPVGF